MPPPVPKPLSAIVLVLSTVTLAMTLPLALACILLPQLKPGEPPLLAPFGFEIVIAVAAAIGIAWGRGGFRTGPAMGLACVAGTILAASALSWQGANRNIAGYPLTPVLALRGGIALAMGAIAAWIVLSRDRRSFGYVARGLAALAPVVALAGAYVFGPTRRMIDALLGSAAIVGIGVSIAAFLIVCVLLAVGGHCLIRAFELGRTDDEPSPAKPAPQA